MNYRDAAYFDGVRQLSVQYLYKNYDYCFLSSMHEKNRLQGADTIIVGSSHAMNGIIEKELYRAGEVISFCVSSQDLFYSFEHVKKAVACAKRPIQRCMINLGYYTLHWDLSKSEAVRGMIPRTYLNLFDESCTHHYNEAQRLDLFADLDYDKQMYPKDAIVPFVKNWSSQVMIEQSSFYGELLKREDNNIFGVQKVAWNSVSEDVKLDYVKNRLENGHNRHIKYKDTRQENGMILRNKVSFLTEHKIKSYFFITPYTKMYMEMIEPKYRPDIFEALDTLDVPVEFLDMNFYADIFTDLDFLDSDHLNLVGAHKATAVLNGYIEMAEG